MSSVGYLHRRQKTSKKAYIYIYGFMITATQSKTEPDKMYSLYINVFF